MVSLIHGTDSSYGASFLHGVSSLYPGFHASGGLADAAVGTLYGLVDGAFGGSILGWLYNRFLARHGRAQIGPRYQQYEPSHLSLWRGVPRGTTVVPEPRCALARGGVLFCSLLFACLPVSANAQDVSAGAVVFSEDFSRAVPSGIRFDREGVWSVADGHLRAALPNEKQKRSFAYIGSEDWTDYSIDLDVCGLRGADKGVAVRMQGGKAVVVDLRGAGYEDVLMYRGYSKLSHHAAPNPNGSWNHLRIEVLGARYRVYVNGRLTIDFSERHNKRPRGRIALVAYTGGAGQCEVLYDNVVVRELR